MELEISAGAMLYAAALRGHRKLYGVKNIPAAAWNPQRIELELMDAGLAEMDFDGGFALTEDFAAVVDACADCGRVAAAACRRERRERRMTCYLGSEKWLLEQTGEQKYRLRSGEDTAEAIVDFLGLADGDGTLEPIRVDTGLVQHRDREGLLAAGCSEAMAALLLNGAKGTGGYAQIFRMEDGVQMEPVTLVYGSAGTVSVEVEYSWEQELFRLTPVTRREAARQIRALLEG